MNGWLSRAQDLAQDILYPQSRWWEAVTRTPRHALVPRWFTVDDKSGSWRPHDGPGDEQAWLDAAYDGRRTLVTRIGPVHADFAEPGAACRGRPTSSSTLPLLVIAMYRHGRVYDGADVLDVGTGCGYGAALLTHRLGAKHVTSIDVDPYLTSTAIQRLGSFGAHPAILTVDATGELPGDYDRIVPMVSMPAIPPSWLAALRPGGRLVFSLTGGSVIITADKQPDGTAAGKVEQYHAGFMAARHGPDYPPGPVGLPEHVRHGAGEDVTTSRYPIVDPTTGWELDAMLSVVAPGIAHCSATDPLTGATTAWMTHEDGSWARATGTGDEPAVVHQGGPRRLWDMLDDIRLRWLAHGALPLRGAAARIEPDGTCHLCQGEWQAVIPGMSGTETSQRRVERRA